VKQSDVTASYVNLRLGPAPVNVSGYLQGSGVNVQNNISTTDAAYARPASTFSPIAGEFIPGPATVQAGQLTSVSVQVFPYKSLPLATYQANLKTNPNATLDLPAPTGTVSIFDGATVVATGTVPKAGLLTISMPSLAAGLHTLEALYSGDSNYAPIRLGSYSVTVGDVPAGKPVIAGIANAASFAPATAPVWSRAGFVFRDFRRQSRAGDGPEGTGFADPQTLSGTRVVVEAGGQTYAAYLVYVSKSQVNAILPSTVPVGAARITVIANGSSSAPYPIVVLKTQVGIFSYNTGTGISGIAQNVNSPTDYPLNTAAIPAKPGQIVLLWGTGMGALNGPDDVAPGSNAADLLPHQ
jgi:uncharacterized protein (TIGR03437 family)